MRRNARVNRGGILLAKNPSFVGELPPDWVARGLLSADFTVQPENAHFVRQLMRLAAENRIAVYWLLPPNVPRIMACRDGNGVHAKYDEFVRGLLAQFPNLSIVDARHAGYLPDVFVDPVHLDRDGAVALSVDVATVLQGALSQPASLPRWIELSARRDRPAVPALEDINQSRAALSRREEWLRR
jgi:hypothetical protein